MEYQNGRWIINGAGIRAQEWSHANMGRIEGILREVCDESVEVLEESMGFRGR